MGLKILRQLAGNEAELPVVKARLLTPANHPAIRWLAVKRRGGPNAWSYLINESVRAGVVVGEGFIHHQEHDAGEEGQGQDDQDGHLEGGQMLLSVRLRQQ